MTQEERNEYIRKILEKNIDETKKLDHLLIKGFYYEEIINVALTFED